ncbi:hypothetical protein SGCOL_010443 [Colletotrichum sp. CLE4]
MAEPSAMQPQGDNKKRKSSTAEVVESSAAAVSKKKKSKTTKTTPTTSASTSSSASFNGPTTPLPPSHEALLADLKLKYDVLPAFTISSTKIQKRVSWLLQHLRKDDGDPRKRAVLVYARPGEVTKMISIVETVKRIVAAAAEKKSVDEKEGSGKWYQYNLMYELPPKPDVVEETVLGGGTRDGSDDEDDFEVMGSRFERAVLPQPAKRAAKSLSIFLSLELMPELKARDGVTTQTNAAPGAKASSTALLS